MITIAKLHYIFSTLLTRNPFVVMVPKHFRKAHVYTLRKTWCSPFWCGAFLFVDRFIKKNFHLWMPRSLCSSCTTKAPHGGGGVLPYMAYAGMCHWTGYGSWNQDGVHFVLCPKQGMYFRNFVLNRVRVAHLYPNIGRVTRLGPKFQGNR